MVQFFTKEYFDELAKTLNNSDEFKSKTANLNVTMLNVAKDKGRAFLLKVQNGTLEAEEASEDAKADFVFLGDYDTWVKNHKGEADLQKLVMTGKIKFKGSIPKIMGLRNQLTIIDQQAQKIPVEY